MPEIDHYQVLGLDSNATVAEIRRAFRALALRYHPDQNPNDSGAEEQFKLVTQAYKVLIDSKRRAHYDRARQAAQAQRNRAAERARRRAGTASSGGRASSSHGPRAGAGTGASAETADRQRKHKPWWEEELQKAKQEAPPPQPESPDGRDFRVDMTISTEMADYGGRQPLAVSYFETCSMCQGTGAKPGTTIRPCPECDPDHPSPRCYLCSGRGLLIQAFCPKCHGERKTRTTKTLVVTIPPRTKNAREVRLPGEGSPPAREGGKPGDLIVRLMVKPISQYEERDNAVYSEVHVTPATAAMGGTVRVKTVDATADLVIPPGTRSGTVFRLEGHGRLLPTNERGDHYVTVKVVEI